MGKKFVGLDGLKHFWTKAKTWITGQITAEVTAQIAEIVANAPEDLDTLKEIADWIKNHANSAPEMNTQIIKNQDDIKLLQNKTVESCPVDVVESGNMHAVTSNAVADAFANAFKLSPIETCTISATNQTAQYDGFLFIRLEGNNSMVTNIYINDEVILTGRVAGQDDEDTMVLPICKGDTFRADNPDFTIWWSKARWYKNR